MDNLICGDCGQTLWVQQEGQTLALTCMRCCHVVSQTIEASMQATYGDRIAELARAYDQTRPGVIVPVYVEAYQAGTSFLNKEDVQHMKDDGQLPSPAWQPLFDAMGVK